MRILHLVLTGKWYDMIASGEKTEEYREIKQFFIKRFCQVRLATPKEDYDGDSNDCYASDNLDLCKECIECNFGSIQDWWENNQECDTKPIYDEVCFHRGYTKTSMLFKIDDITIGKGKEEWGAPKEPVFIIKLGKRL